ncbi:MAG TPA: peptidoglycan editing factor PgeF [Steroidobacteraceae bacterium]
MNNNALEWIVPDWPAPLGVRALATTRAGGFSAGTYASLNLAMHVGDDPKAVSRNRTLLRQAAQLPAEPIWLQQIHGTHVWTGGWADTPPVADAAVTTKPGEICAILTADCLPVLFCADDGSAVGAAHAGWRGLAGGVLEATVAAMRVASDRLLAWLGPAIEPEAFEVGPEVFDRFVARNSLHERAFQRNARGRWQADLYTLARIELESLGVNRIYGGGFATFADARRFYSYRRDKRTGRMGTMVWME